MNAKRANDRRAELTLARRRHLRKQTLSAAMCSALLDSKMKGERPKCSGLALQRWVVTATMPTMRALQRRGLVRSLRTTQDGRYVEGTLTWPGIETRAAVRLLASCDKTFALHPRPFRITKCAGARGRRASQ